MRQITGQITQEIQDFIRDQPVDRADPYPVTTYRRLVEQVAKLAYLNKDYLLFFRGQGLDYRNRGGASTFYPTIYRGDYIQVSEIKHRFRLLDEGAKSIRHIFEDQKIQGYTEFIWKKHVQWSILQHYEVCNTPLFDLTHSLRVACSFAQLEASEGFGHVYVFGLPYVMNRISHNSEHDLVNIRLLSICPPEALRPYFQEGYLAGTEDITDEYDSKDILDFRNRLIAKFKIPSQARFWGEGFSQIPRFVLYPRNDRVEKLCNELNLELKAQMLPGQLGEFLSEWTELEEYLLTTARDQEERVISTSQAINHLAEIENYNDETVNTLQELRKFRNVLVHEPKTISSEEVEIQFEQLKQISKQIKSSK